MTAIVQKGSAMTTGGEATGTKLTEQQARALGMRDASIALSAGAGCGKTFVLTQRFLNELQPGQRADPLQGVVAITFTDRAAREMRDRIRRACRDALDSCAPDRVDHWLGIIRELDAARISTIHSFCAGLLRAHAVDAGIDPQFAQVETSVGAVFRQRAVKAALIELLEEQNEDAMELVRVFGLENTFRAFGSLVLQRYRVEVGRFTALSVEQHVDDWNAHIRSEFLPLLLDEFVNDEPIRRLLELLRRHEPSNETMQERRSMLLGGLPQLPHKESIDRQDIEDLRESARVQGGGNAKAWESPDVYERVRDALTEARKLIDKRLRPMFAVSEEEVREAAEIGLRAARIAGFVFERYEAEKRAAGLLDFDDLLIETRDLLRDDAAVRRRASAGIDFLLVDEFQDTDPIQADIVRLLCGEKLATGKLFLVGDRKQSIYRFRRADPQVFARLREEIPESGRLPLSVNFRSQPEVLRFVNCLFAAEMGEGYEPLVAHHRQLSKQPCIEFQWATGDLEPAAATVENDTDDEDDANARETAEERRRREADWIARRIVGLLEDATPRVRCENPKTGKDALRRVKPGDVVLLFRSMTSVHIYEEALRDNGVEYYLVGGRAFFAQQEVYDLANLCQWLSEPADEVALAGVLRSPFFSLADDTIFALTTQGSLAGGVFRDPPGHLDEDQRRQARFAREVLGELRDLKDRLPLAQLLEHAVERTAYDAALLAEHLGHRKLANLRKLIDQAREFDRAGLTTLAEYAGRLAESVADQTEEAVAATQSEGSDVVRLMTIHQSKGLEFPVVFVVDMDWQQTGQRGEALLHPELGPLLKLPKKHGKKRVNLARTMHDLLERSQEAAETTRLLYVAATRAADLLVLSAGLRSVESYRSPWMKLVAGRFHLHDGTLQTDAYLGTHHAVAPNQVPKVHVQLREPVVLHPLLKSREAADSLADFAERLAQAEPAGIPALLQPPPAAALTRTRFTVTDVRQAAVQLSETPTPHDAPTREDAGAANAQHLGTVVHAVLERIERRPANELSIATVEALLDRCIAEVGSADLNLRTQSLRRVRAVLASPVWEEIVAAEVCYREVDFLLQSSHLAPPDDRARKTPPSDRPASNPARPTTTIIGQIDCLLRTPHGVWKVIDYKTGRVPQNDPQIVLAEYDVQLAIYALAAERWIGETPQVAELVLTHDEVRRVQLQTDAHTLDALKSRIAAAVQHLRANSGR